MWLTGLRLLAGAGNLTLLLPCGCLVGLFGPLADVGANEARRALLLGPFLVGAGGLNLVALFCPPHGLLFQTLRCASLAGNGLVVAICAVMLSDDNLYPFHGSQRELLPLAGVAMITALAVLARAAHVEREMESGLKGSEVGERR